MPSILFVCYANQFRSPVAALFMRRRLEQADQDGGDWHIQSAGTWMHATGPVGPALLHELNQLGVRLEEHRTRPIYSELLAGQDLIVVMEQGQKEAIEAEFPQTRGRVFLLSDVAEGVVYDIPDPNRDPSFSYAEVARDLEGLIEKGFAEICRLAASLEQH